MSTGRPPTFQTSIPFFASRSRLRNLSDKPFKLASSASLAMLYWARPKLESAHGYFSSAPAALADFPTRPVRVLFYGSRQRVSEAKQEMERNVVACLSVWQRWRRRGDIRSSLYGCLAHLPACAGAEPPCLRKHFCQRRRELRAETCTGVLVIDMSRKA